jgi:hypothetical protein
VPAENSACLENILGAVRVDDGPHPGCVKPQGKTQSDYPEKRKLKDRFELIHRIHIDLHLEMALKRHRLLLYKNRFVDIIKKESFKPVNNE